MTMKRNRKQKSSVDKNKQDSKRKEKGRNKNKEKKTNTKKKCLHQRALNDPDLHPPSKARERAEKFLHGPRRRLRFKIYVMATPPTNCAGFERTVKNLIVWGRCKKMSGPKYCFAPARVFVFEPWMRNEVISLKRFETTPCPTSSQHTC